jgi:hypothetical protein
MTGKVSLFPVFTAIVIVILLSLPATALQEVRELQLVGSILKQNLASCNRILKAAHVMHEQAEPFLEPKFQAKFRFKPSDKPTREILTHVRSMASQFKLLSGILYHSKVESRHRIFKMTEASLETLANSSKRALRAIRDGNHALYLASAQTADREAKTLFRLMTDMEDAINASIEVTDESYENL